MELEFKTFPIEVKADETGASFQGMVSVFHNIDSYGEIVDDGAFDQDLPFFLSDGFIGGLNHDWDNPIGTVQPGTKVVDRGLLLCANVIDTTHGMDVRKMLKAGVVKKLSIGYRTLGATNLETAEDVVAYWETKGYTPNAEDIMRAQRGARVLTRIKTFEGSPVTMPANSLATITAVKAAREAAEKVFRETPITDGIDAPTDEPSTLIHPDERVFEKFLRDAGYSKKQAVAIALHGFKSLLRDAASGAEPTPDPDETPTPESSETPEPQGKSAPEEPVPTPTPVAQPEPEPPTPLQEELAKKRAKVRVALAQRLAAVDAKFPPELLNAGA